jgi:hypothetical protein
MSFKHLSGERLPKHEVGFVYVMSNTAMAGLVKVGMTMRLSEERALELQTTGVPAAFTVEFRALTSVPKAVEAEAHAILAAHRVSFNREFFKVPVGLAVEAVRTALLTVAGLDAWDGDEQYLIGSRDRIALTVEAGDMFAVLAYPSLLASRADLVDLWQAHSDGDLLELMGVRDPGHVAGFSEGDPGGDVDPVPFLDRTETVANGAVVGRERLTAGARLVWMRPVSGGEACKIAIFEAQSHCQVIARTWAPKLDPHGRPYLLNDVTSDPGTPGVIRTLQAAQRMTFPRNWAPRNPESSSVWAQAAKQPLPPERWLTQLQCPGNRHRRR